MCGWFHQEVSSKNMDISETIKFRDVCVILNRIAKTENKDKKGRIVKQYYESFCKHREKFREEQKLKPDMPEVIGTHISEAYKHISYFRMDAAVFIVS